MIKEILTSIAESAKERIKNPFLGGFIIAWIFVNWDLCIVFLFGDHNVNYLITRVSSNGYWRLYILPFIGVCIYIIINPWIGYGILWVRSFALLVSKEFSYEQRIADLRKRERLIKAEWDNNLLVEEKNIEKDYRRKNMELTIKEKEIDLEERLTNMRNAKLTAELEDEKKRFINEKKEHENKWKDYLEIQKMVDELIYSNNELTKINNRLSEDKAKLDDLFSKIKLENKKLNELIENLLTKNAANEIYVNSPIHAGLINVVNKTVDSLTNKLNYKVRSVISIYLNVPISDVEISFSHFIQKNNYNPKSFITMIKHFFKIQLKGENLSQMDDLYDLIKHITANISLSDTKEIVNKKFKEGDVQYFSEFNKEIGFAFRNM